MAGGNLHGIEQVRSGDRSTLWESNGTMRFTKMHGAGNDYVYVNCFEEPVPRDPAELARRIADRHYGVGGDGLVLICPSQVGDARMRMFNADGSESEMCGNAIRCVGKYVYDRGIARREKLRVETGAGLLTLELEFGNGAVDRVRVDMGAPILAAAEIPTTIVPAGGERVVDHPADVLGEALVAEGRCADWQTQCGLDRRLTCVSMGNPHATLYCRDVAAVPLEIVGPKIERHEAFPRRINVHFVQVHSSEEVTMRTWERGSGITLACGTGASAVCVSGVLTGRTARRILAHLPGGDLELEWREADNHVYMTGGATEVFSGEWPSK
jgi:diaminopimelate epimerase